MSPDAFAALVIPKGIEPCILVTDAVLVVAATAGSYLYAGLDAERVSDRSVVRPGLPNLAGSALCLAADALDALFARLDRAISEAGYLPMSGRIMGAMLVVAPRQRNT
ncbi:hypothetical protein Sa4125_41200 [Aureimonas sp. SA4125]|uniref:hypothetical protein n=1 Tax=Aureimonas sp. SA4125 TaxID=2826993 RepID=UPI001CC82CC6|nr:hypothetical protein [Aureimonas sp. SA4125]BDA86578.1 hypothetical protein Sa4125_41200 [Aureimonas sp. SA4125]